MCELCENDYKYNKIAVIGNNIRFLGSTKDIDLSNCFKFCPICGRRLTNTDFEEKIKIDS